MENNANQLGSLSGWFYGRPKWLQVAAKRLLEFGNLNDVAISEVTELCKQEANNSFPDDIDCNIPTEAFGAHDSEKIRLCSISNITGVNKLSPRKPLNFGDKNIAVVYGCNGSGKSGYVRLLKHVCRARDCVRGKLHKDVFSPEEVTQKAKIDFLKNDVQVHYEWSNQKICDDLRSVDIFDTSFGSVFMGSEGEVSYEPPILSFFSRLTDVCEKVATKLDADAKALISKMPNIPNTHVGSLGEVWLKKLNAQTPTDEVESHCSFTPENETELQELQKRISEQSPADKAQQLKNKKKYADALVSDIKVYLNQLSDESCKKIIDAKKKYNLKKSTAEVAAVDVFRDAKIEGVGSDVWKELWNAARKYSEEKAYFEQEFPHVQDKSVCVLCHQPLSEEAKQRFISFEKYIKDETQQQVVQAKQDMNKSINALPEIPNEEAFRTKIDAAGIEDQDIIKALNNILNVLRDRKSKVSALDSENPLGTLIQSPEWIEKIRQISQSYEDNAQKYEKDATKENRIELEKKLKNLQARKWLSEQKIAIQKEIKRLQKFDWLLNAKSKANTATLSKKKGELAEALITEEFVKRFNNELDKLGASKINVELVKSKVIKGKVLHTLQLNGANNNINEVLSEGELRIVSIAAFLADVTGKTYPSPFVFDDPISSLDQDYEEAVVQRLCKIASERQVIIFTHRLSLLGMIQDDAKKVNIEPEIICIQEEPWGTGEPCDTLLQAQKPKGALNTLIYNRLPDAKKLFNKIGKEAYNPHAIYLCIEFRKLLERMVEYVLMADVVQRHRRAINTMGKIGNLAKISADDCSFFDGLMTKYSKYVHSQSDEAPVNLPEPDELEEDFKKLESWHVEFNGRRS